MYYDLIVKIKNAEQAGKAGLSTAFSKMDFAVAAVMVEAGYLEDAQKKVVGKRKILDIKLPRKGSRAAISGFKIVSKPARHIYVTSKEVRPVKQGYGVGIISTSKGIMSDKEARKNKIGGEYLLQIW